MFPRSSNQARRKTILRVVAILSLVPLLAFVAGAKDGSRSAQTRTALDPGPAAILKEARLQLQAGVNTWNLKPLESARTAFLALVVGNPGPNAVLLHYAALADYRLAVCHLAANNAAESEYYVSEGQRYAAQAVEADPSFSESHALQAYLLGLEVALHPDRAMSLAMQSMTSFAKALQIGPGNPRVNLLKGIYQLYVPEAYGGGPASALEFLEKSAALFERETPQDPLLPSWGKEEAYTYLGRVYGMNKDIAKAKEYLMKALAVNPDFGLAKSELQALAKIEKER